MGLIQEAESCTHRGCSLLHLSAVTLSALGQRLGALAQDAWDHITQGEVDTDPAGLSVDGDIHGQHVLHGHSTVLLVVFQMLGTLVAIPNYTQGRSDLCLGFFPMCPQ